MVVVVLVVMMIGKEKKDDNILRLSLCMCVHMIVVVLSLRREFSFDESMYFLVYFNVTYFTVSCLINCHICSYL